MGCLYSCTMVLKIPYKMKYVNNTYKFTNDYVDLWLKDGDCVCVTKMQLILSLSLFIFFLTTRHPIISVKRFFFPASIITAAWVLWRLNNAQGKSSKWPACPAYVNYTGYIEKWLSHVYTQRSCSVTEIHEASRAFFSFFFLDKTNNVTYFFYSLCALGSRWPRCVTLRGLPLHGGVAVAPGRFQLAVTPLTADRGITRSEHISSTDSLQRWDPATEPRSTQQDLQKDAFFHKCLEKFDDDRIFPKTKQKIIANNKRIPVINVSYN